MHPVEKFIHQAKHSSSSEVRVTSSERNVPKEIMDPAIEKRAKKARMALLAAIDERPRLENLLERAGTDLVLRRGRIELKQAGADFPEIHLPTFTDGSDTAERARLANL